MMNVGNRYQTCWWWMYLWKKRAKVFCVWPDAKWLSDLLMLKRTWWIKKESKKDVWWKRKRNEESISRKIYPCFRSLVQVSRDLAPAGSICHWHCYSCLEIRDRWAPIKCQWLSMSMTILFHSWHEVTNASGANWSMSRHGLVRGERREWPNNYGTSGAIRSHSSCPGILDWDCYMKSSTNGKIG